jgi:mono/diheme cytochrome c family protein
VLTLFCLSPITIKGSNMRLSACRIALVMLACTSRAALAANPDNGLTLSQRWCATCHVVDSDQKRASADVPPFAAIAGKTDFTAEKVAFFLLEPHPKMPNFPLSRDEAADIAAYIGTLRK